MEAGVGDEVFAENDERLDGAGADAVADGVEFGERVLGFQDELRAGGVRVAVGGDEQGVGFGETGDQRELVGAEFRGEGAGEEEFLIGHAAGGDDGDLLRGDVP